MVGKMQEEFPLALAELMCARANVESVLPAPAPPTLKSLHPAVPTRPFVNRWKYGEHVALPNTVILG